MLIENAVSALGALAHPHRLNAFRLLVRHGPDGLPAGRIAELLSVPASTLSTHLAQLERSALLRSWRVGQRIYYAIDIEGTRDLIGFLLADCCEGRPEICGYAAARSQSTELA